MSPTTMSSLVVTTVLVTTFVVLATVLLLCGGEDRSVYAFSSVCLNRHNAHNGGVAKIATINQYHQQHHHRHSSSLSSSSWKRPSYLPPTRSNSRHCPLYASSSSSSSTTDESQKKTTLDETTTWNLRMVLQNLPTTKGKTIEQQIIAIRVKFIEEVGYEPPQGELTQVVPVRNNNNDNDDDIESSIKILNSRWQLSEDPNERKDSLWIWGLFSEPLYPFLLLKMEFDEIPLPPGGDDSIAPFTLFAQINHKREDGQVLLSSGADLTIKQKETIKADPFGAATVDVFDDVKVGQLQIQAITK